MIAPAAVIASSESSPGRKCRSRLSIRPKRTMSTRSCAGTPRPPQRLERVSLIGWSEDLRRCGVSRFPTKSCGVSAAGSGWVLLNASLTRPGTVRSARSESQVRSSPRVVE
ncbi:hypothetical protein CJD44_11430 [Streptomyces sp. alain-838]|nr:hypothetical protein CJD44_11430 [Streptomyces sp. alain-838]